MFNRVLVTGEEIDRSLRALEKGMQLMRPGGHTEWFLRVYHAAFEEAIHDHPESEAEARALFVKHRSAQAERLLEDNELTGVGVDVAWHPSFVTAIEREAQRYEPDLMVVPRLPQNDLADWLLGGDEQELVRELTYPLLFCGEQPWPQLPRIAVAIDPFHLDQRDSSLEERLLVLGDQIAAALSAELHVVHCFQSLPQSAIFDEQLVTDYAELQHRVGAQHRARIEELLAKIDRPLGPPLMQLLEGDVQVELPEFCQRNRIDLLLLGASDHSAVERLLMGSTTERLLERIRCDLLVLHR